MLLSHTQTSNLHWKKKKLGRMKGHELFFAEERLRESWRGERSYFKCKQSLPPPPPLPPPLPLPRPPPRPPLIVMLNRTNGERGSRLRQICQPNVRIPKALTSQTPIRYINCVCIEGGMEKDSRFSRACTRRKTEKPIDTNNKSNWILLVRICCGTEDWSWWSSKIGQTPPASLCSFRQLFLHILLP